MFLLSHDERQLWKRENLALKGELGKPPKIALLGGSDTEKSLVQIHSIVFRKIAN